jgi:Membrane carboxypeptidase/penicillin-binding protein
MDFSKKGIENKQNTLKSNSRRIISKARIILFRLFILTFLFLAIVGTYSGYGFIKGLVDSAPEISQIDVGPNSFTTTIYDKDGNEIDNLAGAQSNRVFVAIDDLPVYVKDCFVSIEDERFYEHNGIDIRGIFRAGVRGLSSMKFDQGASTITQQLLKNQVFNGGQETSDIKRVERKIQEQYLAIQLEHKLNKKTILEDYINTINLGAGTYGIQTASKRYFDKDAKDLTLSEAATIAAIAQLPVYRNPITHPQENKERRDEVLKKMLDLHHCTKKEYDEAMADDVYSRIQNVNNEVTSNSYYSYFVDELIEQVMNDLQSELGYTQAQASTLIYSGGLSIYTTQDSEIQNICDKVYSDESNFPRMGESYWELTYALSVQKKDGKTIHYHNNDLLSYYKNKGNPISLLFKDKDAMKKKLDAFKDDMVDDGDTILGETRTMIIQPQSSFVVMDQYTGQVQAIVGGRGEKTGNRTLNRATNTLRSPGSTFKIVSTYLPAFDTSGKTLASVQDDAGPYYYPDGKTEVNNWYEKNNVKNYKGLCTLRQGIYDSLNIVTVKTLVDITSQVGFDYLKKLGFTSLDNTDATNYAIALGGLKNGVSNLELTAAYAAIANDGIYTQPTFYTKILNHDGKVLINKIPKKEQVMKESTSFLLTNAMEDVVKVGTGTAAKLRAVNMPVAGKTGTSTAYKDLWFAGFTPYYTATIWSGFDHNQTQENKVYQKKIWKKIMEQIHIKKDLKTKSFPIPDSIVTAKICTKSGKLAVDGLCDQYVGGNSTRIEYFAKGTEPTENCNIHVKASICTLTNALATNQCPVTNIVEKVFLDKKETCVTADSPFLLPSTTCNVHNGSTITNTNPLGDPLQSNDIGDTIRNIVEPN